VAARSRSISSRLMRNSSVYVLCNCASERTSSTLHTSTVPTTSLYTRTETVVERFPSSVAARALCVA
jgi:hypothetical protein